MMGCTVYGPKTCTDTEEHHHWLEKSQLSSLVTAGTTSEASTCFYDCLRKRQHRNCPLLSALPSGNKITVDAEKQG